MNQHSATADDSIALRKEDIVFGYCFSIDIWDVRKAGTRIARQMAFQSIQILQSLVGSLINGAEGSVDMCRRK